VQTAGEGGDVALAPPFYALRCRSCTNPDPGLDSARSYARLQHAVAVAPDYELTMTSEHFTGLNSNCVPVLPPFRLHTTPDPGLTPPASDARLLHAVAIARAHPNSELRAHPLTLSDPNHEIVLPPFRSPTNPDPGPTPLAPTLGFSTRWPWRVYWRSYEWRSRPCVRRSWLESVRMRALHTPKSSLGAPHASTASYMKESPEPSPPTRLLGDGRVGRVCGALGWSL
jgi:hypothetical protein